jgi:hypothetical protein
MGRKAIVVSMVLGIAGGVLALVFVWLLYAGILYIGEGYVNAIDARGIFLFPSFPAGVLGILGGILVRYRRVAGGVILIIAACLTMPNFVSMALLIAAAVVALRPYAPESASQAAVPPPLPQEEFERGHPATKI